MINAIPGCIRFSLVSAARTIPNRLQLQDHSFDFVGNDLARAKDLRLLTGACGPKSRDAAIFAAAKVRAADPTFLRTLIIDVTYRVSDASRPLGRWQCSREMQIETGWLPVNRLVAAFRDEIKEELLEMLKKDTSVYFSLQFEDLPLDDLLLRFPSFAGRLLEAYPSIRGITHPVHPAFAPAACLWVATVRYDTARVEHAEVRGFRGAQITH